jgi:predicted transport protein
MPFLALLSYQRKAIEFKDLPIELLEIKSYVDNIILFNQIKTPDKRESITKVSRSEVIERVRSEVRAYTEEYHFNNTTESIRLLYSELKEKILLLGTNISVKPKAKYIAFLHRTNFVDIVVRKSNLTLFLHMAKGTLNDPKHLTRDVSTVGHWGNGDYKVILKDSTNLDYVSTLIVQSYEKN